MKKLGLLILAAATLFAFSCSGALDAEKDDDSKNDDPKMGTLVFSSSVARSIFPDVTKETFTNVVLKGKFGDEGEKQLGTWKSISAFEAAKVEVKLGTWNLTLSATKESVVFTDTKAVTVNSGENPVSFALKKSSWGTGTGTISATLTVPDAVKAATFTLKKLNETSNIESVNGSLGTPTNGKVIISYEKSGLSAANQYDLSVTFYGDSAKTKKLNEVSEVFTVGTGLISTWTAEFKDLNSLETTYKITYNLNGGTIDGNYSQFYTESSSAITLPTPTKSGYTFNGWFTNSSFTGTAVTTISAGSTGDKTFWAKWTENPTVPQDPPAPPTNSEFFPDKNASGVFEDTRLFITFDDNCSPALGSGTIKIYEQGNSTAIDTIKIGGEITYDKNADPKTTNVSAEKITIAGKELNVKNFLVQVYENQLVIIPHAALSNNKTYIVEVPASAVTNAKIDGTTFAGTTYAGAEWKFKTRASYTPSNKSSLRVGTSSSADYATVQKAIDNANDNATITLEKGVYHEIIRSQKNLKIVGDTTAQYGSDVVIRGINVTTWNPSTHDRAVFYQNGKNLVLKNLTIENAYTRDMMSGQSEHQAEAFFLANGTGKTFAAYNCSFKSYQDTIQNSGKNWFYKCYIEGDTDFIWGTADVCLVEESKLVALSDSSYFMVSRTGNTSAETVAKGYVALNCDLEIKTGSSYFGRNPGGSGFYDQVAIINPKVSGTLNSALWKSSSAYSYYDDASAIGWKVYNVKNASGSAISTSSKLANTAVISSDVYSKEYNGRDTILNRVYNKTSKAYERAAEIWDVTSLATEFNATADTSKLPTKTSETYIWDFTKLTSTIQSSTSTFAPTGGTGSDSSLVLNIDAKTGKLAPNGSPANSAQFNNGTKLSFPVGAGDKVEVVAYAYNNCYQNITINGTAMTGLTDSKTYSATGTCEIVSTADNTYIVSITLTKDLTGGGELPTGITLSSSSKSVNLSTDHSTFTLTATVTPANASNKNVTWTSSDATVATVNSNGNVTCLKAGSTTITATSEAAPTIKASCTLTVTGSKPTSNLEVVTKDATVTTYGWADVGTLKYPNPTNVIEINDANYPDAKDKMIAFRNAISKGSVTTSGGTSNSDINNTAAIIILSGTVDLSSGKVSDTDHTYFDQFDSSTNKRKHDDFVIYIGANKTILGINDAKIAFGGITFKPSSSCKGNIIIRNVTFWDAHGSTEKDTTSSGNSSSKASADNFVIEGSGDTAKTSTSSATYTTIAENIWIDHCKFTDGTCDDLIRNLNHDGALDVKAVHNMTISYCEFTNHDKVTLLAPNDDYYKPEDRQITFHHNYYHNATQRMPRSRGCQVHVYNNYYNDIGVSGNGGFALGPGIGSQFIVENTNFGTFTYNGNKYLKYFDSSTSSSAATVSHIYASGNSPELSNSNSTYDSSTEKVSANSNVYSAHKVTTKPWTITYSYTSNMQSASELPSTIPTVAGPTLKGFNVNGTDYQ